MDSLSRPQTQYMRALAHNLKPVVIIGNKGLTEAVLSEVQLALDHHELIKVKLAGADREQRAGLSKALCESTGAVQVSTIGRILTLYRANPDRDRDRRIRPPTK